MPLYLLLFHKDNEFFGLIGQYRRKAVNNFSDVILLVCSLETV